MVMASSDTMAGKKANTYLVTEKLPSVASSESKNSENIKRQERRQTVYDKRMSVKHKKMMKERKYFRQHDDILESNILYSFDATKSPHIVLFKWYHQIKNNCILLQLKEECEEGKNRKIFYGIMEIGNNVKLVKKQIFVTIPWRVQKITR